MFQSYDPISRFFILVFVEDFFLKFMPLAESSFSSHYDRALEVVPSLKECVCDCFRCGYLRGA